MRAITYVATLAGLTLSLTMSNRVAAQASFDFAPPHIEITDPVGVQLNSGLPLFAIEPISIGPSDHRLAFNLKYSNGSVDIPTTGTFGDIEGSSDQFLYGGGALIVKVLDSVEPFVLGPDGLYHSFTHNGATLTVTGGNVYNFTDRSGATYTFQSNASVSACTYSSSNGTPTFPCAYLNQIAYPSGETLSFYYSASGFLPQFGPPFSVSAVVRSDGYALRINGGVVQSINLAIDYCNFNLTSCTLTRVWPQATFAATDPGFTIGAIGYTTVTNAAGSQTRYTRTNFDALGTGNNSPLRRVVAVRAGSSTGPDTTTFGYYSPTVCVPITQNGVITGQNCSSPRPAIINQVTTAFGAWTYSYTQLNPTAPPYTSWFGRWQTLAARPDGFQSAGIFNIMNGFMESVTASNGSVTFQADPTVGPNRTIAASDSEGRVYSYPLATAYDDRGNTLTKTQVASSGTSPTMRAGYDTVCANPVTCNKPNWIQDAKSNETDYTYDPTHGGVLSETLPADSNGVRPQKRYTYVQRYPWLRNASGGYTRSATPIWKLNTVSSCQTGAWTGSACAPTNGTSPAADLVVTTYDYGPDAGPNTLLVRGVVVSSGSESHRTCYAYDSLGNKISETTPNANLGSCP